MEGKHYFDEFPYPTAVRCCTGVTSLSSIRFMRSSGDIGVSFEFAPNKNCGRAIRTTPIRLTTVKKDYLAPIKRKDWPRAHPANSSRNANGSCRKIAPPSAVNVGDKSCRTVDRSKFLGMDVFDGASGVKELRCYELTPMRIR